MQENIGFSGANRRLYGLSFAILASCLWGSSGLFVSLLSNIHIHDVIFFRFFLSFLVTSVFVLFSYKKNLFSKANWFASIWLFLFYVLTTTAFSLANIVNVSLMISVTPLIVVIIRYVQGIKMAKKGLWGCMLAFLGAITVVVGSRLAAGDNDSLSETELLGEFCAFMAACSMAIFSLKSESAHINPLHSNFLCFLIGSLASSLLYSFTIPANVAPIQIYSLVSLVMLSTICAGIFYKYSCQLADATAASVIRLSSPVFAAILSYIFLAKGVNIAHFMGTPMIIIGVYLVVVSKNQIKLDHV